MKRCFLLILAIEGIVIAAASLIVVNAILMHKCFEWYYN